MTLMIMLVPVWVDREIDLEYRVASSTVKRLKDASKASI